MNGGGIRKATEADRATCIGILTRAFDDDPAMNWLVRQDEKRGTAFDLLFQTAFDKLTFPFGEVYVTEDGGGAALWCPPGTWKLSLAKQLSLLPAYLKVCRLSRMPVVLPRIQAVQNLHPPFPHFYLFALGVMPSSQGRGLGSALLRHVLAKCDEQRLPAYLEASTAKSRDLYMRHGFRVIREFLLDKDGPLLWFMLRDLQPVSRTFLS